MPHKKGSRRIRRSASSSELQISCLSFKTRLHKSVSCLIGAALWQQQHPSQEFARLVLFHYFCSDSGASQNVLLTVSRRLMAAVIRLFGLVYVKNVSTEHASEFYSGSGMGWEKYSSLQNKKRNSLFTGKKLIILHFLSYWS